MPAADQTRWLGLRIARDGTWLYRGSPIRRKELVKLFASVLRRDAQGGYWLVTPAERGRIEVDDVPFVAVELAVAGGGTEQRVRLRTNLDEWLTVGPEHRLSLRPGPGQPAAAGPVPYVEVRPSLEARLGRPVYYELVELGAMAQAAGREQLGVWSAGCFFPLGEP
jgi:hypothetical protein